MINIYTMPGHLIRRMNQISASIFAERMAGENCDLTSVQYAALAALEFHPGIDQATLASMIAYDRVTIGGVVERLEVKRLLERKISLRDKRARLLTLTPAGKTLLERLHPVVTALQEEILSGLDQAEKATLLRLLEKAAHAGNKSSRAPLAMREPR